MTPPSRPPARVGHGADIAEDRRQRPEALAAQQVPGQGRDVGQEVAALPQMAEAEGLAEMGQAVQGVVQERNRVPEILEGRVYVEHRGVRQVGDGGQQPVRREQAAGIGDPGHRADQGVGRAEDVAEIGQDRVGRRQAAAGQERSGQGQRVGQEVAALTQIAEAECLAESRDRVDRRVQHRDLVAGILQRGVQIEDGLVEDAGRRAEDAVGPDQAVAVRRRCRDRSEQGAGGRGDGPGIARQRRDRAGPGRVGASACEVGDQVAARADMAEAHGLAEIGQPVQRPVQRGDRVAEPLQLRMGVEHDLVRRRADRVGQHRSARIRGAGIDGALDERGDRAEARELAGGEGGRG